MNIQRKFEQKIMCPITYDIFKNPVIASDGNTYEHDAIFNWCLKNRISPLTREKISLEFYPNNLIRQLAEDYLEEFPEKRESQYEASLTYNVIHYYLTRCEHNLTNTFKNVLNSVPRFKIGKYLNYGKLYTIFRSIKNNRDYGNELCENFVLFIEKIDDFYSEIYDDECSSNLDDASGFTLQTNDYEDEEITEVDYISEEGEVDEEEPNVLSDENLEEILEENLEENPVTEITVLGALNEKYMKSNRKINTTTNNILYCVLETKMPIYLLKMLFSNFPVLSTAQQTQFWYYFEDLFEVYREDLIEPDTVSWNDEFLKEKQIKKQQNRRMMDELMVIMIDKGVPLHFIDRSGRTNVAIFLLKEFYSSANRINKFTNMEVKLMNLPGLFAFPPEATQSPEKALEELLKLPISVYGQIILIRNYLDTHRNFEIDCIWEFFVKHSVCNIIDQGCNIKSVPGFDKLLFEIVKLKGFIPVNLMLIKCFNAFEINHCFIEGYLFEHPNKYYSYPKHDHLIPPILTEDTLFDNDAISAPDIHLNQKQPKTPFVDANSRGGRLQRSIKHGNTNWLWDTSGKPMPKVDMSMPPVKWIQESPKMTVLSWLAIYYPVNIVFNYVNIHYYSLDVGYVNETWDTRENPAQNPLEPLELNAMEYTGLEYVNHIHVILAHPFYKQFKRPSLAQKKFGETVNNVVDHLPFESELRWLMRLLELLLKHGANLSQKTSHGWLPVHYICKNCPELIWWVIKESGSKYLNEPLYFYPSQETINIYKAKKGWFQTWYPLNIVFDNYFKQICFISHAVAIMLKHGANREVLSDSLEAQEFLWWMDYNPTFHNGSSFPPACNDVCSTKNKTDDKKTWLFRKNHREEKKKRIACQTLRRIKSLEYRFSIGEILTADETKLLCNHEMDIHKSQTRSKCQKFYIAFPKPTVNIFSINDAAVATDASPTALSDDGLTYSSSTTTIEPTVEPTATITNLSTENI